ncbi:unnamed protein product, partial [Polarella glacialis]
MEECSPRRPVQRCRSLCDVAVIRQLDTNRPRVGQLHVFLRILDSVASKHHLAPLPFTPRTYESIKDSCLRFREDVGESVRSMKRHFTSPGIVVDPGSPLCGSSTPRGCGDAAVGSRCGSPKKSAASPRRLRRAASAAAAQSRNPVERVSQRVAACRDHPVEGVPMKVRPEGQEQVDLAALDRNSVALMLQRSCAGRRLSGEDVARVSAERQALKARQRRNEAGGNRNFVGQNKESRKLRAAKPEIRQHVFLMQALSHCVRADNARCRRQADFEALKENATAAYRARFFEESSIHPVLHSGPEVDMTEGPEDNELEEESSCEDAAQGASRSPLTQLVQRVAKTSVSGTSEVQLPARFLEVLSKIHLPERMAAFQSLDPEIKPETMACRMFFLSRCLI